MSRYKYNEKAYFEMVHEYEKKIHRLKKQIEEMRDDRSKDDTDDRSNTTCTCIRCGCLQSTLPLDQEQSNR